MEFGASTGPAIGESTTWAMSKGNTASLVMLNSLFRLLLYSFCYCLQPVKNCQNESEMPKNLNPTLFYFQFAKKLTLMWKYISYKHLITNVRFLILHRGIYSFYVHWLAILFFIWRNSDEIFESIAELLLKVVNPTAWVNKKFQLHDFC